MNGNSVQSLGVDNVFMESEISFSVGVKISYGVDLLFVEADIYAKVVLKCVDDTKTNYRTEYNSSTGHDCIINLTCHNFSYGVYLMAGVEAEFWGVFDYNLDIVNLPIFEKTRHYENSEQVSKCTADTPPTYASIRDSAEGGYTGEAATKFDPNNKEYNYAVVMGRSASVEYLHLKNGGTIDLNGKRLTISKNLTIDEGAAIYVNNGELIVKGNASIAGRVEVNGGSFNTDGDIYNNGGISIGRGTVYVGGDVIQVGEKHIKEDGSTSYEANTSAISMNDKDAKLTIIRDYYVNTTAEYIGSYSVTPPKCGYQYFNQGIIELKGNLYQYGRNKSFFVYDGADLILSGEGIQNLYFENTNNNGFVKNPIFKNSMDNIRFTNGLRGFSLTDDLALPGTIGDYHLDIDGTMTTNGHNLTIKGDYYLDDETINVVNDYYEPENIGRLIIDGNLYQTGGYLGVGGGIFEIRGDYLQIGEETENADGSVSYEATQAYLAMYNPTSEGKVLGDFITSTANSRAIISEGKLELMKNLECFGRNCSFASRNDAQVCLAGTGKQRVVNERNNRFIVNLKLSNDVSNYIFESGRFWNSIEVDKPGLLGYQASVDGAVELNYCVLFSDEVLENDNEVYMTATVGNGTKTQIKCTYDEKNGYYKFCVPINAPNMSDTITASLVMDGNEIKFRDYSLKEYANTLISENKYADYSSFAKAMLNYGGYAQVYFGHNTGNLANNGLYNKSNDPVLVSSPKLEDEKYSVPQICNDKLEYMGMSLTCNDKTSLNLYYTYEGDWKPEDIELSAMNSRYSGYRYSTEISKNGHIMKVKIGNIPATHLDDSIKVQVRHNGQLIVNDAYNPMMYVKTAQNVKNKELCNLANAIYHYNKEAVACFE